MKSAVELAMERCCCKRLTQNQKRHIAVLDTELESKTKECMADFDARIAALDGEGEFERAEILRRERKLHLGLLKDERDRLVEMIRCDPSHQASLAG